MQSPRGYDVLGATLILKKNECQEVFQFCEHFEPWNNSSKLVFLHPTDTSLPYLMFLGVAKLTCQSVTRRPESTQWLKLIKN